MLRLVVWMDYANIPSWMVILWYPSHPLIVVYHIDLCVSYLSDCCEKIPDKHNSSKEGFTSTRTLRVYSIMAQMFWCQKRQLLESRERTLVLCSFWPLRRLGFQFMEWYYSLLGESSLPINKIFVITNGEGQKLIPKFYEVNQQVNLPRIIPYQLQAEMHLF